MCVVCCSTMLNPANTQRALRPEGPSLTTPAVRRTGQVQAHTWFSGLRQAHGARNVTICNAQSFGRGQPPNQPQPMSLARRPFYDPIGPMQSPYIKLSDVMDKDVISSTSGRKLGKLGEAWVDASRLEVTCFDLESNGAIGVVPLQTVRQVGDVVLVQEDGVLRQPLDTRFGFTKLLGWEVRTPSNRALGKVRDMTFSRDTGTITKIEFDDFGLRFLRADFFDRFAVSADAIQQCAYGIVSLTADNVQYQEKQGLLSSLLRRVGGAQQLAGLLADGSRGGEAAGLLPQGYSYEQWQNDVRMWEAQTGFSYEEYMMMQSGGQGQQQQLLPGYGGGARRGVNALPPGRPQQQALLPEARGPGSGNYYALPPATSSSSSSNNTNASSYQAQARPGPGGPMYGGAMSMPPQQQQQPQQPLQQQQQQAYGGQQAATTSYGGGYGSGSVDPRFRGTGVAAAAPAAAAPSSPAAASTTQPPLRSAPAAQGRYPSPSLPPQQQQQQWSLQPQQQQTQPSGQNQAWGQQPQPQPQLQQQPQQQWGSQQQQPGQQPGVRRPWPGGVPGGRAPARVSSAPMAPGAPGATNPGQMAAAVATGASPAAAAMQQPLPQPTPQPLHQQQQPQPQYGTWPGSPAAAEEWLTAAARESPQGYDLQQQPSQQPTQQQAELNYYPGGWGPSPLPPQAGPVGGQQGLPPQQQSQQQAAVADAPGWDLGPPGSSAAAAASGSRKPPYTN